MRFSFTGDVNLNGIETKNPYIREGKTSSGASYQTFSFGVVAAKNNRAYVELFSMKNDKIKTKDTDGNNIEIGWDDRFDEDVVKSVANYRKNVINIGDERKEFISSWDAVEYLKNNIDDFKNSRVTVTGQVQKNIYNGKISDRFTIQNIYVANDDVKNKLQISGDVFWTADDIETEDWRTEKKLAINGYTSEYIDKDTGTKYIPQRFVFDASKIDFDNEKHIKLLNFKLKQLGLTLDDGKVKSKLKSKKVYKLGLICNYVSGAEEIEFDESTLTDNQREAIELGIKSLQDFQPKGQIYGNRVVLYKIVDFNLTGDGENGVYDSEIEVSEFEDDIYKIVAAETVEDLEKEIEEKKAEPEEEDEEEDLFS